MSLLHPDRVLSRKQFEDHRTVIPIDHPDGSVTRAKLEYPTVDVSLAYLQMAGRAETGFEVGGGWEQLFTTEFFADKAIEFSTISIPDIASWILMARFIDFDNHYRVAYAVGLATKDFVLTKEVAGVVTNLAFESVDLTAWARSRCKLSCLGTTISAYRDDLTTPVLSVTDVDLASGRFGGSAWERGRIYSSFHQLFLRAPSSPPRKTLAYFEVPITGTGIDEDPFRPQMPEELTTHPKLGTRNLLALPHASLIPTDPTTGKPIHGTALVRIFEQPDRDPTLRPIPACLGVLRRMEGVVELTRDDALRRAREMDDRLHLFDLISIPEPTEAQINEYIAWRKDIHGVEMTKEEAKRYLKIDKGW